MVAYLCNHCEKPLDMEKENVHLQIRFGSRAIRSNGQYGDGYSADLCENCYKKLQPLIDKYYYGGNKYLKEGADK
jgi:hypothetical protein